MSTPRPAPGPAPGTRTGAHRALARVGSEELHSMRLPPAHEAAVLYAADNSDAAIAVLKAEIKDAAGKGNRQAWLMLFDLYQAAGNRAEFDALSILFTVKFEQSPPVWSATDEGAADPRRSPQSRERKDLFTVKPGPGGEILEEIAKFRTFAGETGSVRLDLTKVTAVTSEEAAALTAALRGLRARKTPMWFNGLEDFERILRTNIAEKATDAQRAFWLLLFELLIVEGKGHEFEELGLEYAVAFEISPPNWETYVNTVAAAAAKAPAPSAKPTLASPGPNQGYPLKGVLSAASANQIAELNGYASSHAEVAVDMDKVLRVELSYATTLFEVVRAIQSAGKRVVLTNLNELNAGLLEAFGFSRFAILVRKKSI
jgi:anti-anti-sigma regulatory factor